MKSTNYCNTLILVATDCPVPVGTHAKKPGSVGALQLDLLLQRPYALTSDELIFEVHAIRHGIAAADRAAAWAALFAKPQACLRASPLVKTLGWGLHHDAQERVAAYGRESHVYAELAARADITKVPGMRSRRGSG